MSDNIPETKVDDTEIDTYEKKVRRYPYMFRNVYIVIGVLVVIGLHIITDPDNMLIERLQLPVGAGTVAMLLRILTSIIAASMLFVTKKAMHDYPAADFEQLGVKSAETADGAAKYAIALAIDNVSYAIVMVGAFIGIG